MEIKYMWRVEQKDRWPFTLYIKSGDDIVMSEDLYSFSTDDKTAVAANVRVDNKEQWERLEYICLAVNYHKKLVADLKTLHDKNICSVFSHDKNTCSTCALLDEMRPKEVAERRKAV